MFQNTPNINETQEVKSEKVKHAAYAAVFIALRHEYLDKLEVN